MADEVMLFGLLALAVGYVAAVFVADTIRWNRRTEASKARETER